MRRNSNGDWVEKIGKINIVYPACIYMDCDFFSKNNNKEQFKEEWKNHMKNEHGVD